MNSNTYGFVGPSTLCFAWSEDDKVFVNLSASLLAVLLVFASDRRPEFQRLIPSQLWTWTQFENWTGVTT